jgi:hypothetical protein
LDVVGVVLENPGTREHLGDLLDDLGLVSALERHDTSLGKNENV